MKPLAYIDALRGYAVTLVIASHAFPISHYLPWTIKRFSNIGFFGVQLFFVISCFTLTRSWRRREIIGRPGLRDFIFRRVFRIAPAYFLTAIGYYFLMPSSAISVTRLITFLTFTNGWNPAQMPTVPGEWVGVPGGWSIEAEFAFYALFPIVVVVLRGPWKALTAMVASLPLAWIVNAAGCAAYQQTYGIVETNQFLYYWLPNQFPVFLCGLFVYECVVNFSPGGNWQNLGEKLAQHSSLLLGTSVLIFLSLGLTSWPRIPMLASGRLCENSVASPSGAI